VGIPVRFPFGHGLHYTTFEYSNLRIIIERDEACSKRVRVSLDVTNIPGNPFFSKPAKEVVQLYIKPISSSVHRPHHELKAFSKIKIVSGSTERVEFVLDERAFSYYDIGWRDWLVEEASGGFEVCVGASSRDIRLTKGLKFSTGRKTSKSAKESYPPRTDSSANCKLTTDDATFSKRLGGNTAQSSSSVLSYQPPGDIESYRPTIDEEEDIDSEKITRNTLMVDAAKNSRIAAVLMFVSWMVAKQEVKEGLTKKRELRMIRANLENVPLRSLVVFSQGNLTFKTMDVLIHLMNGEYRKALGRLFRRRKQNITK
jgi:beta-glucosidase